MEQTPKNSKLSKDLFKKRVIDWGLAIGVKTPIIPNGWIIENGKAIKIQEA